jgi:hypothetical protein
MLAFNISLRSYTTATVKASCVVVTEFVSETSTVSLAVKPTHTALDVAGMWMTLPDSPRYAGDTFAVNIRANTGGKVGRLLTTLTRPTSWRRVDFARLYGHSPVLTSA